MSRMKLEDRPDIEVTEKRINLVKIPVELKPGKRKHVRFTRVRHQAFLENFLKTHNFAKSAYFAGVDRETTRREMKRNDAFKKAVEEIEEMPLDRYEEVLHNLADREQSISITPAIFNLKS
jgi:hypothetical protein